MLRNLSRGSLSMATTTTNQPPKWLPPSSPPLRLPRDPSAIQHQHADTLTRPTRRRRHAQHAQRADTDIPNTPNMPNTPTRPTRPTHRHADTPTRRHADMPTTLTRPTCPTRRHADMPTHQQLNAPTHMPWCTIYIIYLSVFLYIVIFKNGCKLKAVM
jgi:hypothetical protein